MSKKITNYVTTNKSDRNVNKHFDQKQFNIEFEKQEVILEEEQQNKLNEELKKQKQFNLDLSSIWVQLESTINKIFPDKLFAFSIGLIIIGSLLLVLSNLMKPQYNLSIK